MYIHLVSFVYSIVLIPQDVQQKVRPYILALDMSHFKYDDFIRVLDIVNRYVCTYVDI